MYDPAYHRQTVSYESKSLHGPASVWRKSTLYTCRDDAPSTRVASARATREPPRTMSDRASALAQLARFKKQRAKTHLERMWDRRASAAPGVGVEADQFR